MSSQETLLNAFYRHVATGDLEGRDEPARVAVADSLAQLSAGREPGRAAVRVHNPTRESEGWTTRHSVLQACTDDMPFLVDSVLGELQQRGLTVHLLIHPQMLLEVDPATGDARVLDGEAPDELRPGQRTESWMYLEVDRIPDEAEREALAQRVTVVLDDVRRACADWRAMRARCREIISELQASAPATVDPAEVEPTVEFLTWLEDNHFTFLGYREYDLVQQEGDDMLRSVPQTGLGILGGDDGETMTRLSAEASATARDPRLLTITKANSRASVHRPVYLDYVGLRRFDDQGEVVAERRFLGLFTASAYAESVTRLPIISGKVEQILRQSGFAPDSHSGKDLLGVLEAFPRDELFQASERELYETAMQVLHLQERRRPAVFLRPDEFGRFVSVLIFLPRDRYTTAVRRRMEQILRDTYDAASVDDTTRIGESAMAQLHCVVRMRRGSPIPEVDPAELQRQLLEAARGWEERLSDVVEQHEENESTAGDLLARYAGAFPEAYKEDFGAETAFADLTRVSALDAGLDVGGGPHLYTATGAAPGERRLKLYRSEELSLTDVLPLFADLGVRVIDERPYLLEGQRVPTAHIYDFGLLAPSEQVWTGGSDGAETEVASAFEEAFAAVWGGDAESDTLNSLVLTAGLTWRQVVMVRTLVRYLRQVGIFSLDYLEEAMVANPAIVQLLVELFSVRFDPARDGDRQQAQAALREQLETALDEVASLDQDRIIRSAIDVLAATLRTNFYQPADDGRPKAHVSLKLSPREIDGLPEPRPAFEIWVYAPRVEGVHLRFGEVARGGLRWSDRREDFRTEVLGLVKAQTVKNAVIVPTGSKGGFVAKQLPDPALDREAWQAEGIASYRVFISGLLDVTDNRVDGQIVPPSQVVRHDGDDPYLVVAADKGTATFSDIANAVARDYGFWLDDAFASGGSAGYDHKAMGITARGAWESVKRHFRELGLDTQTEEFTAVGIGDMSGDVFGNGMLLSEHIRLVAAFDHRHIFLDPEPDAATSFAERSRLFELPRSSWADYDTSLISEGGGVYPRTAKSVPVSPQVRERLGLDRAVSSMTPQELLRAILTAPADLLWNGGIGTYVKASTETDTQIGDRANDAIRVDGAQLRARVVGEGGNLGLSQLGRIEAAQGGVQLNTDAIDNSAGVDTSDHEVNIKIALTPLVSRGELSMQDRDELLASMTDEVAQRVLRHNYEQNVLIGNARHQGGRMVTVHERLTDYLAEHVGLDPELEFLPDAEELRRRDQEGLGLTSPEFSVLVAYSKMAIKEELLRSELPDDQSVTSSLLTYFPEPLRHRMEDELAEHPLRRQIIVNEIANAIVNRGGVTFVFRAAEETGATVPQIARAFVVCREVFDLAGFVHAVEDLDNVVSTGTQTELYLEFRRLLDRAVRWFLNNRSLSTDPAAEIERFRDPLNTLTPQVGDLLQGTEAERFSNQAATALDEGVPEQLARVYAGLLDSYSMLDVVELARESERPAQEVAEIYFAVSEEFRIDILLTQVSRLMRDTRWDSLARGAVRDDLYGVMRALSRAVLIGTGEEGGTAAERVEIWRQDNAESLARVSQVLRTVGQLDEPSLAAVSVALRTLRGLVRQGSAE